MPRMNKKVQKIAFNILGTPANMRSKQNKKQKELDKRLIFDETTRVK